MKPSDLDGHQRQACNNRAFARARDRVAGAGAVVGQGVTRVRNAGAVLIDVQPEHAQKVARRADPGRLLQRPEKGGPPPPPPRAPSFRGGGGGGGRAPAGGVFFGGGLENRGGGGGPPGGEKKPPF